MRSKRSESALSRRRCRGTGGPIVFLSPIRHGHMSGTIATLRTAPRCHILTVSVDYLCALPVPSIVAVVAVLWLWSTNYHMRDAYKVVDAWGLEPKTIVTWVKPSFGHGDILRGQTEQCIVAVRGKPIFTVANQSTVLLRAQAARRLRKPPEFYDLVES